MGDLSSTARGQHGTRGKAEDHVGRTLPSRFPSLSHPIPGYSGARPAAERDKKEHPTARVAPRPGHPCQVLTKTWNMTLK